MTDAIDSLFDPSRNEPQPSLDLDALRRLLQTQANTIVAVGTGGSRIQDVDAKYQRNARALDANFRRLGLQPPFPYQSLWDWYGFYSQNLSTYRERREHVRDLTQSALSTLDDIEARGEVHDPAADDETPTWENLNARIAGLVKEYSTARDRDDWQDVGRRSREILIDFGKLIADPAIVPKDQEAPKGADAKAWFDLFLARYAAGRDKAELRATMRAVWDLSQKVTHGDIADVDAFAAAQATVLVVRTAQKLLRDDESAAQ
ncbi:hypothetical protein GCM10017608_11170 [Agromyces luteolus]|uniref:Uncharacterized protein n=1 Tax=Agromyces luteolus TaxID=88373 RepID=A0A7C9HN59_9MICO|nr:hypothetical protein [Agromyces luteolus]MUN08644.1 hypothetical protein [Agromyces luteolus]GLK27184.1 hypothetical protein GCM10017608_11170 [Agromyces luteolus]